MSVKGGGKKPAADTSALYAELSALQQSHDFEKAFKVCNRIITASPQDATAFHCKMVCLIQTGRFDDALKQIRTCHLASKVDVTFEEAYAHYRKNDSQDALEVLEKAAAASKEDRKRKELRAQVLYRLERYEESYAVYKELMRNTSDDFESERLTNVAAVMTHLEGKADEARKLPGSTYEVVYNQACCLLADGKAEEAERMLEGAERMCVDYLNEEEEADQEDVDQETGVVKAQRAYAVQVQGGRDSKAQGLYNAVLRAKPSDIGLVAVASNNLLAINRDQNVFDSKKRIKAATADGLEHKLSRSHMSTIARNGALLSMYTNQVGACRAQVEKLLSDGTIGREEAGLITAGVLARAGKTREAVEAVDAGSDVRRVLVAAQILLEKGMVGEAVGVLETLEEEVRFRKGVLSALVTLTGKTAKAASLLKQAVARKPKGADAAVVWRKAAEFHLEVDEPGEAAASLEELLRLEPGNRQTLAQLVLAYAKYDLASALSVSRRLPPFAPLDAVDVKVLEEGAFLGATRFGRRLGDGAKGSPRSPDPSSATEDRQRKRKKKKRKKRLPKEYNPKVDPDPERWLPRRERTGYRKNRKERRKGEKFTGAQGVASGTAEVYDYSQKKGASPKPRDDPASAAPVGPRQQHRKPQQKKKKGGGKQRF